MNKPVIIDWSDLQSKHMPNGTEHDWVPPLMREDDLTQRVSKALDVAVEPIIEVGYYRYNSGYGDQGLDEHTDNNPYTALLYSSDIDPANGGEIVFPDNDFRYAPRNGEALVYPGTFRHYVTPQVIPQFRGMLALAYKEKN
jgi:hypothetical protein